MPKRNKKKWSREQDLLAAKPRRGSVSLDRRGRGAEKKRRSRKEWSRGMDPLTTKLERSPTARGSWGQVRPNKKVEAKENRQMGWRVSTEPLTWNLRGALNVKPVVDNMGPYTVAIAGMPLYQVAGANVQRRQSWEEVRQEARKVQQHKGSMPTGKESPTATRKKVMPREKRREITREASMLSPIA